MTDLISSPGRDLPSEPIVTELLDKLTPIAIGVGMIMIALYKWVEEMANTAEERHLRAERLAAYKVRRKWKASDIKPLLTIGVSGPAQRRMSALQGSGRPVVQRHRPLEEVVCEKITNVANLFRDDATPRERRNSFRASPLWKHCAEALYRGELAHARAEGRKGPSDHAEKIVAEGLCISQAMLHLVCGEVRAMRRADPLSVNFPPMILAAFENWMERGQLPKELYD